MQAWIWYQQTAKLQKTKKKTTENMAQVQRKSPSTTRDGETSSPDVTAGTKVRFLYSKLISH